jgi:TonB-linked SusC/RagA family outer membrane protein
MRFNLKKTLAVLAVCLTMPFFAFAQNIRVSGTVKDQSGEPVIGAGIMVQNTQNGAVSGADGSYSITVPSGAILEISSIGYKTQLVPVSGRSQIDIVLEEDAESLEATVVIGYGTARKSDVTGSIVSMGGNELREIPAADVTYALMGRVAGVDMQSTSSKPGASATIRIRGERSLSASNDPLIVLDGIPFMGSLSEISTNDIKSIDILKDAASTAIYGSRGANGVILISTYKGTVGQAPKVSFNAYASIKTPIKYPMMTGAKYVRMRQMAGKYANSIDESDDTNTDWQDMILQNGYTQNYEVSVTGGTQGGSYRFGTSYYKDHATLPTQAYSRISLNGSIDQKIGKYFQVGFSTTTQYGANTGNQVGLNLQLSPLVNPYDADGNLRYRISMPIDADWYIMDRDRVEQLTAAGIYNSESNTISTYNNGFLKFNFPWIEGLSFKVSVGLNYRRNRGGSFTGQGVGATTESTPNTASWSFSENFNWTVENLLSYDRTFGGKHRVNFVALYSAEQTTSNGQSLNGNNIPNELFQWYNIGSALASDITVNTGSYTQYGLMSYMARLMYSYDDRYMISAAVRSDASSRLAPGHQWHTYPAVSIGWNIHKEPFMQGAARWMDELKLRVGYGVTSNQAVSPYSTLGSLSTKVYNFNEEKYATGYYVSTLPNTELGWEYSNTWNFGLDYSFFKGRLRGTIEYYRVDTMDILLSLSLPASAGVSRTTANIGATRNRGIEFTVNGTILEKGDWKWDAGLNIYANRNQLVALADGTKEDKGNRWFVGYPLQCIYDYEYDGLWQEGDPYMDILEPSKVDAVTGYKGSLGMIKVKYHGDYNADGSPTRAINSNDQVPYSAEATFMGGFNTRLAWKNLDLTIIGDFQVGGIFMSSLHTGYENLMSGRRGQIDVDYWTPEKPNVKYPRPGSTIVTDSPKYASLMGQFDGTYAKVQTITLGYTMHRIPFFQRLGISNLRVYFTAQNPFVIYSAFTAETGLIHQGNARSGRMASFSNSTPQTHNYLLGINLTF